MEELLIKIGLTDTQATIYLQLLDGGRLAPPALAAATKISRTNTYKVLERLKELGLVNELEINKKLVYEAKDPSSLNSLAAVERNRVATLEESISQAMQGLRQRYQKNAYSTKITRSRGKKSIIESYRRQIEGDNSPIFFIKSRDDITFMGYENMNKARLLPAQKNILRFGITPDVPEVIMNPKLDFKSSLTRTWISADDYTVPVEWSVNNKELIITVFEDEGRSISISDPMIAQAFQQIWKLLDKNIKQSSTYKNLPTKASRLG